MLEDFINDVINCFDPNSEHQIVSNENTGDWDLANAAIHYINYFKSEIKEADFSRAFDEVQLLAFEAITQPDAEKEAALLSKFKVKFIELGEYFANN